MIFKTKFTLKDTENYDKWVSFYPKFSKLDFIFEKYSYFDPRPQVRTSISLLVYLLLFIFNPFSWLSLLTLPLLFFPYGEIYLYLPFDSGFNDEADTPQYGFYFYGEGGGKFSFDEIWLWWGFKPTVISMPWQFKFYKTEWLGVNNLWIECDSDNPNILSVEHDFNYTLKSGKVQKTTATVKVRKTEWRRNWFMKSGKFNLVKKFIDIEFKDPMGEETESWKGGVLGTSFAMNEYESPYLALKRMEREYKM